MDRLKGRDSATAAVLLLGLACAGCPSSAREAPPPAESLEIASAAPRAIGALAGGTEAAPTVGSMKRKQPQPDDPFGLEEEHPQLPGDEDELPDAGAAPSDAGPQRPIEEVPL